MRPRDWLPLPAPAGGEDAGGWGKHNWLDIVWLKPAVVRHTLERGYATMLAGAAAAPAW